MPSSSPYELVCLILQLPKETKRVLLLKVLKNPYGQPLIKTTNE